MKNETHYSAFVTKHHFAYNINSRIFFYTIEETSKNGVNCGKWFMHTKNIWKHIKHANNLHNL
jgi:hypothetical protein